MNLYTRAMSSQPNILTPSSSNARYTRKIGSDNKIYRLANNSLTFSEFCETTDISDSEVANSKKKPFSARKHRRRLLKRRQQTAKKLQKKGADALLAESANENEKNEILDMTDF